MAINDTINFNSTVHYFKLYNDENNTLSSASSSMVAGDNSSFAAVASSATEQPETSTISPITNLPSSFYPSSVSSTPSTPLESTSPSTIPLVAATTLTITSTIINNYASASQNYSNSVNSSAISSFNQSTLYQFRNLSINASSDESNLTNLNDSAKIAYESGSNFMLLLEDFGEYFYNYNGSDYNSTISIYQTNCSLTNSTCSDVIARKSP